MQDEPSTVAEYLAALPLDRRATVEALRRLVLDNLPPGYVEAINWGMICYEVPLETSGRTYNGKPLMYAAIGNQKRHIGLYLCGINCLPEGEKRLRDAFAAAGLKLDMGKACIRLRTLDDLPLDAIGDTVRAVTPEQFAEASRLAHDPARRRP